MPLTTQVHHSLSFFLHKHPTGVSVLPGTLQDEVEVGPSLHPLVRGRGVGEVPLEDSAAPSDFPLGILLAWDREGVGHVMDVKVGVTDPVSRQVVGECSREKVHVAYDVAIFVPSRGQQSSSQLVPGVERRPAVGYAEAAAWLPEGCAE